MTDIYLICSDGVFRRMLELELTERGAHVCEKGREPSPPCGTIISAPDLGSVKLPEGEDCPSVVFGYQNELESADIPPSCLVLTRPFAADELSFLLFGEDSVGSSPALRKRSISSRITLDRSKRAVHYGGMTAKLSKREFPLFEFLYENRGKPVTRREAYSVVWGGGDNESIVDVYICYLREKTEKPFGIRLIRTVRGTGYMLEE